MEKEFIKPMDITDIESRMKQRAAQIESELRGYLDVTDDDYGILYDAMRYSLLAGGKRLRPFLALEFARLAATSRGLDPDAAEASALAYASAIEMIHTYSLIHDDLPCMDDDDLRRGKPTNHKVFGEANALLAGDALLTLAFEVAASNKLASPETNCRAVVLLSTAAGANGMVGGQVLDLIGESSRLGFDTLERLQSKKTGELIRASSLLGCYAGGADEGLIAAAERYSMGLGRAFQVLDDILDVVGDTALLGKPIGSDAASDKTTFLTFMTPNEAYAYADRLTRDAVSALEDYDGADVLCELAIYLSKRNK